ncbi:DUF1801 domain-containing protein [Paucisalibacillus sp. EB02]|uniref:DUF1801 domain-containing protein n=1 Tax=Paucisalibacillus sp. EB02 TaxID=1347087 RepID=UPI0004AF5005|nr:DUF1801 domain-containing protein [Paucisalibacillus sp. EB02]
MSNEGRKIQEVDQYIANLPEEIQAITSSLREIILNTSSELIEEYKWSMPNYSYNGLVCYLQASKKHVNLGFQKGNELEDKDQENLLQGSGKTMRHIRMKKMEDINPEYFISLIHEAMELNRK